MWTQKQGGAKKVYGEYTDKDVTFNDGDVILEDDVTLDDGYYTWWLEAVDNAFIYLFLIVLNLLLMYQHHLLFIIIH